MATLQMAEGQHDGTLGRNKSCPSHNYSREKIYLSAASEKDVAGHHFQLIDEIELEDSPLTLKYVSKDKNSFETEHSIQVAHRMTYKLCVCLKSLKIYQKMKQIHFNLLFSIFVWMHMKLLADIYPITLWQIHVKIEVEGKEHTDILEPESNLKYRILWDKRDVYGQKVYGRYVQI